MGYITIDELSAALKAYLESLGLSEEEVNNIVNNALVSINEKNEEQDDAISKIENVIIGAMSGLMTNEKGDMVKAINELCVKLANGKKSITTAIGNGANENSSNDVISGKITDIKKEHARVINEEQSDRNKLYTLMYNSGNYSLSGNENIDELLSILELNGISNIKITKIVSGPTSDTSYIITNKGTVYCCGENGSGQFCIYGSTGDQNIFVQSDLGNIIDISAGRGHGLSLHKNSIMGQEVVDATSWGDNQFGQLGRGNVGDDITYDLCMEDTSSNSIRYVKQVAALQLSSYLLKTDGTLYSCGYNSVGQLGWGTSDVEMHYFLEYVCNNVKQVAAGGYHVMILKNDGSVWGCGDNGSGQLGLNNTTDKTTFTQVTTNINNDVKQIACGNSFTYLIKNDGSLWYTNNNKFTQVTTNINNDVKEVVCGGSHVFIIKNDGSLWCRGTNRFGELGVGDNNNRSDFVQISTDVKQVACGRYHSIILKNDDTIWASGYNYSGQLGVGDNTDKNVFTQVTLPF